MKVIVYGGGRAPESVQRVQTLQLDTLPELRTAAHELSGGQFIIVVLDEGAIEDVQRIADEVSPPAILFLVLEQRLVGLGRCEAFTPFSSLST